ncbi:MAG: M20/M25/M40 family metallo-hydrolase [Armatimonadetes bacterium]|nr:MAG: M20/M25/M40 family metallo-hydrolase [Armatimonadota bacterium]
MDRDRIEYRTSTLVATPSPTGSEHAAIDLVASWISPKADEVDQWITPMAELQKDPAYPGIEVERNEVPVIAARAVGSRPGPVVVLTGHVDVVPIGDPDTWSVDPGGELRGSTLFGRGACDMKAGVVACVEVFNLIADGPRDFAGEVCLVVVSGEEDGGCGTLAAIRRGWVGDAVIVAEPSSGPEGPQIVAAHGGALTFTIRVAGRGAHAAKRRDGESALDHFITVYGALRRIENELNDAETNPLMTELGLPYPTTVGIVRGGEWASNVMDHLEADIRVGVALGETIPQAEARFARTLSEAIAGDRWLDAHPPSVVRTGAAFGSSSVNPDTHLVQTLGDAAEAASGTRPRVVGASYGCDMALWINEANAVAAVYGPGDVATAHAPDERVDLDEVTRVAEVLTEAIRRFTS